MTKYTVSIAIVLALCAAPMVAQTESAHDEPGREEPAREERVRVPTYEELDEIRASTHRRWVSVDPHEARDALLAIIRDADDGEVVAYYHSVIEERAKMDTLWSELRRLQGRFEVRKAVRERAARREQE